MIAENFSNLERDTDIQIQEPQSTLSRLNKILAKVKDKEKILKISREKC